MPKLRAAVALTLALAACASSKSDGLLKASTRAIDDDTRFASATGAAQTYVDVSATLLKSSEGCAEERAPGDSRCAARAAAAGFFRVMAAEVVDCDRAGRRRTRAAARAVLDTVLEADRSKGRDPARQVPALPRCAS